MSEGNKQKKLKPGLPKISTFPARFVFLFLCIIPVFSIIAFGGVDAWQMSVVSVFSAFIFFFWLLDTWKKGEFQISTNIIQLPLIGLILIGLIQLLPLRNSGDLSQVIPVSNYISLSFDPYLTRFAVIQLIIYSLFFAAALVFINSRKRVKIIVNVLVFTAAIMSFLGIIQRIGNFELIYGFRAVYQAAFFSSFVNQHHFASFMLMTIGLSLALFLESSVRRNKKIFLLFGLLLMAIAIILTGSRGALLSLIAVVGFVISFKFAARDRTYESDGKTKASRNFRIPVYIVSFLTIVIFLIGSIILLGGDQSLIRGIGLAETQGDFSNGRLHFWSIALQNFSNHPILGTGLDSFGVVYPEYDTWNGIFRVEQTHNDYLQILSDAGIFGFICVISFIVLFVKKGFSKIKNTQSRYNKSVSIGAFAGCLGILIHSFVDFPLRTPANTFVFLILVVLATDFRDPKKKRGV
jgi:O-antigen ligase